MTPDQRLLATAAGYLLAALLLFGAGLALGHEWRDRSAKVDLAECQLAAADAVAVALRTARAAEAEYRAREARARKLQQEALDAANTELRSALADRDRLRAALQRLRAATSGPALGGGASQSSGVAASGAPASTAADLQADMLWRLGEAAGQLAAYADDAAIAGRACERAYDAVTTPRL